MSIDWDRRSLRIGRHKHFAGDVLSTSSGAPTVPQLIEFTVNYETFWEYGVQLPSPSLVIGAWIYVAVIFDGHPATIRLAIGDENGPEENITDVVQISEFIPYPRDAIVRIPDGRMTSDGPIANAVTSYVWTSGGSPGTPTQGEVDLKILVAPIS